MKQRCVDLGQTWQKKYYACDNLDVCHAFRHSCVQVLSRATSSSISPMIGCVNMKSAYTSCLFSTFMPNGEHEMDSGVPAAIFFLLCILMSCSSCVCTAAACRRRTVLQLMAVRLQRLFYLHSDVVVSRASMRWPHAYWRQV